MKGVQADMMVTTQMFMTTYKLSQISDVHCTRLYFIKTQILMIVNHMSGLFPIQQLVIITQVC